VSGPMSDSKNFELSRQQLSGSRLVPGGATAPGRGRRRNGSSGNIFAGGERVGDRAWARSIAVVCVVTQGAGLGDGRAAFGIERWSGQGHAL